MLAVATVAAVVSSPWSGRSAIMAHPAWSSRQDSRQHNGTNVDYMFHGVTYQGYVSLPAASGSRVLPGVLVAHQWMGLGDYEKSRADELAAMGYVAFALDVYGKGVRCTNVTCAQQTMKRVMDDMPSLLGLIAEGTSQLLKAGADADHLVAIGYCFGGSMVLELARHPHVGASAGVAYRAVSSVHGVLAPLAKPASEGEIVHRVQVHHAELDFQVRAVTTHTRPTHPALALHMLTSQGDAALVQLEKELKVGVNGSAGLWETTKYAKCEHGWTEPDSPVYRARAAVQAHKAAH